MTTEIDEYLSSKNFAVSTIKTQQNQYKYLADYFKKPIVDTTDDEIIDYFNNIDEKPSVKKTRLNVAINIKKFKGQPIHKLNEFRFEIENKMKMHTETSLNIKNNELPSYEDIVEYMEYKLFPYGKWKEYIINYLLLVFGVRNLDLDVFITNDAFDDNINYLVVKPTEIIYIVNKYKTYQFYGQKIFNINDERFINAVKQLPINEWLMTSTRGKDKGKHILEISIGRWVQDRTYNNMGEADYCKILLKEIRNQPNGIDLLQKLSLSRGTSMELLMHDYNLEINKTTLK